MASIKYTAFVNEVKGKIGGTVFQGGYGGPIAKNKPTNTKKTYNAIQTGTLGVSVVNGAKTIALLATQWRALSSADRLSWSAVAPEYPFKNRFGETYIGSGFQVYMMLNANLVNANREALAVAPVPEVLPITPAYNFTEAAFPALELNLVDAFPAGTSLLLKASAPMSPTNNNFLSKFKVIKIIPFGAVFPLDVTDDYVAARGSIPAGAYINWAMEAVSLSTGQKGAPVYFTTQL